MTTPTRAALLPKSTLQQSVRDGLTALKAEHRKLIDKDIRGTFVDSLDVDTTLRKGRERENRWDYLLGYRGTAIVIGLEPHSAKSREVSTVIRKRRAALDQLKSHMKPAACVTMWFWVASGRVDFVPYDKANLQLQEAGITFVGRMLRDKHLPKPLRHPTRKKRRR